MGTGGGAEGVPPHHGVARGDGDAHRLRDQSLHHRDRVASRQLCGEPGVGGRGLAAAERRRLYLALRRVLREAVAKGGRADEPDLLGRPGGYERILHRVPAAGGQPLPVDDRRAGVDDILLWKPDAILTALRASPRRNYALTLVTNRDSGSLQVVERSLAPGADRFFDRTIGLSWPPEVYSLSHVALPFAPDDPLYGSGLGKESPGIRLGDLALRGERGALAISDSVQLRQRWNPFYAYLEDKSLAFLQLAE